MRKFILFFICLSTFILCCCKTQFADSEISASDKFKVDDSTEISIEGVANLDSSENGDYICWRKNGFEDGEIKNIIDYNRETACSLKTSTLKDCSVQLKLDVFIGQNVSNVPIFFGIQNSNNTEGTRSVYSKISYKDKNGTEKILSETNKEKASNSFVFTVDDSYDINEFVESISIYINASITGSDDALEFFLHSVSPTLEAH